MGLGARLAHLCQTSRELFRKHDVFSRTSEKPKRPSLHGRRAGFACSAPLPAFDVPARRGNLLHEMHCNAVVLSRNASDNGNDNRDGDKACLRQR